MTDLHDLAVAVRACDADGPVGVYASPALLAVLREARVLVDRADLCATCHHPITDHSGRPDAAADACISCPCPRMVRLVTVQS